MRRRLKHSIPRSTSKCLGDWCTTCTHMSHTQMVMRKVKEEWQRSNKKKIYSDLLTVCCQARVCLPSPSPPPPAIITAFTVCNARTQPHTECGEKKKRDKLILPANPRPIPPPPTYSCRTSKSHEAAARESRRERKGGVHCSIWFIKMDRVDR